MEPRIHDPALSAGVAVEPQKKLNKKREIKK